MNNWMFGLISALLGVVFLLYRRFIQSQTGATLAHTEAEDKTLQQQQLDNQKKLAQVNKELNALYKEHEKLSVPEPDSQAEADKWNQPKP